MNHKIMNLFLIIVINLVCCALSAVFALVLHIEHLNTPEFTTIAVLFAGLAAGACALCANTFNEWSK